MIIALVTMIFTIYFKQHLHGALNADFSNLNQPFIIILPVTSTTTMVDFEVEVFS